MLQTVTMTTNKTTKERPRQRQQQHRPLHRYPIEIKFQQFDPSPDVTTSTQLKASVQRVLKPQILDDSLLFTTDIMDELLPLKQFSTWSSTRLART